MGWGKGREKSILVPIYVHVVFIQVKGDVENANEWGIKKLEKCALENELKTQTKM